MMAFPGLPDAQQRADVIAVPPHQDRQPTAAARGRRRQGGAGSRRREAGEGAAKAGEADPRSRDLPRLWPRPTRRRAKPRRFLQGCHAFEKGAPSPIGPNLYGVVGRKIASVEGFNYSPAMKAHAKEAIGLRASRPLVHKPAGLCPGNHDGLPRPARSPTRADVIDFLRTKSDNPVPLPEAAPAAAPAPAAEEKPAEGASRCRAEEKPAEAPPAPAAPRSRPRRQRLRRLRSQGRGACRSGRREPQAEATPAPEAPKAEDPAAAPAPAPEGRRQPRRPRLQPRRLSPRRLQPRRRRQVRRPRPICRRRRRQRNRSQPIPTAKRNSLTLTALPRAASGGGST